jgi:predicted amidophosphoribosyltransferase
MEELAHRLARFIRHHPLYQTADLLVPIPTNDQSRPFDLVIRLAELVGSRVQLPVFGNLLQKTRTAPKQRDLRTLEEKQQNVAGLYRCLNSSLIQGRSVVLFDDLFDNGATLDEASRVLKAAGAKACYALTITRTGRTGERVSSET